MLNKYKYVGTNKIDHFIIGTSKIYIYIVLCLYLCVYIQDNIVTYFICICESTYRNIAIRALAWILAYINFVRIPCDIHTSFLSVCILVCIHVNRQTRWNIEYHLQKHRNTSYAYPAFSLCAPGVVYLCTCVRVSRNIEYYIQKYRTHIAAWSLLQPNGGNTAIYPAEVYTRVAAVNSRPGTGYVIVRDPIAWI